MTTTDVATRVADLVEPLLTESGHELYDVVMSGATLHVYVAGSIDLDELGRLTRAISTALDAADPIPDRYTLEVSTPGLERTLRTPRHFAGAVGEKVKVKTTPTCEVRRLDGALVAADDEGFVVDSGTEQRRLSYADVERARTVFEWGPPAKPVSPSRKPGPSGRQSGKPGPSGRQSGKPGPSDHQSGKPGPSDHQSGKPGPSGRQSRKPGPSGRQSGKPGPSGRQSGKQVKR